MLHSLHIQEYNIIIFAYSVTLHRIVHSLWSVEINFFLQIELPHIWLFLQNYLEIQDV